jgi:hypothetical protein
MSTTNTIAVDAALLEQTLTTLAVSSRLLQDSTMREVAAERAMRSLRQDLEQVREACAQICDEYAHTLRQAHSHYWMIQAAENCALKIRATIRGAKP